MRKLLILTLALMLVSLNVEVKASQEIESPYYTYTLNAEGKLIQTTEAYTPGAQLYEVNNERFETLEHVHMDDDQYTYITDSGIVTRIPMKDDVTGEIILNPITNQPLVDTYRGKIFILDENFDYMRTLIDEDWLKVKSVFVTEETIYVVDAQNNAIYLYDKQALIEDDLIVRKQVITKPSHPIFNDVFEDGEFVSSGYPFRPEHVVVDLRGNLYVQAAGSNNGLMMLDSEGEFMTFFGGHPLQIPVIDQIRSVFLTEAQKVKMQNLSNAQLYYDIPKDVALDEKGFIYTVTSSKSYHPIQKLNVSGRDFYRRDSFGTIGMQSLWVNHYANVYAINDNGQILEYDADGNLLFLFSGKDYSSSRTGLLLTPVSITASDKSEIIVADQGGKFIQVFNPTPFALAVHRAFDSYYNQGDTLKSSQDWAYVLSYNQMFDYAHIGLGHAFMGEENYEAAYEHYEIANYYEGMSDARWSLRQIWMQNNLNLVLSMISIAIIAFYGIKITNKKTKFLNPISNAITVTRHKSKVIDGLFYIGYFIKHPLNGYYQIKYEKRIDVKASSTIYGLIVLTFIGYYAFTNIIFLQKATTNIFYELVILVSIFVLWVISNYLVCAINDGEGSMKDVFNASAYALSPIIFLMTSQIVLSHVLTLNESILMSLLSTVTIVWIAMLVFFMIKDIHNYSVKETIQIILKSLFTMLIFGLLIYILNSFYNQMADIVIDIWNEVRER